MADNQSHNIWWPALCGEESEYDAFWSDSLTVNTSSPDVTICFERTVLVWLPAAFLFLSSLLFLPYCWRLPGVPRKFSRLQLLKVICGVALVLMSLVDVIEVLMHDRRLLDVQAAVVRWLMMVFILFFIHWTFRKGFHTSGVLFVFWLVLCICDAVRVASYCHRQLNHIPDKEAWQYYVFYAEFALVAAMLLLNIPADVVIRRTDKECVDEKTPLLDDKQEDEPPLDSTNPCPILTCGFVSFLSFAWFGGLMLRGFRRTLVYEDLWDLRPEDSSDVIVKKFTGNWIKELSVSGYPRREDGSFDFDQTAKPRRSTPSLSLVLFRTFWKPLVISACLQFSQISLDLINPLVLSVMIDYVGGSDPFVWHGFGLAAVLFLIASVSVLFFHHASNLMYTVGMRVRTAMTGAIYRKALRLSSSSRKQSTAGQITNLMSVDIQKLQDFFTNMNFLWLSPVSVCLGTYLLWTRLGVAAFAGILWYAAAVPAMAVVCGRIIKLFQITQMKKKDIRLKLINQVLAGIKVVKLYAWEPSFEKRISEVRESELKVLRKGALLFSVNLSANYCATLIACLLTFTIYTFTSGVPLSADAAFVSLSLLNAMNLPILVLQTAVLNLVQFLVSVRRLRTFLLAEEINTSDVGHAADGENSLATIDGTFSWDEGIPTLQGIYLSVPHGKLVAVVGQVGCGKTSLISALLGEMHKLDGTINVNGSTAYVPQQAWIQNMSLRQNILFGKPYTKHRYQNIINACALQDDLKILVGGDMIEIGERGINLSGGQKQRVSLARACYRDCDVYLLDDPLSAVDAHIGRFIFERVIGSDGLLRNKTRVFVTHSVAFLSQADLVVVMGNGRITECGTYTELLRNDGAFSDFIRNYLTGEDDQEDVNDPTTQQLRRFTYAGPKDTETENGEHAQMKPGNDLRRRLVVTKSMPNVLTRTTSGSESEDGLTKIHTSSRRRKPKVSSTSCEVVKKNTIIIEEEAQTGSIPLRVLKVYMRAASFGLVALVLFGFLGNTACNVGSSFWLSIWTNDALLPIEEALEMSSLRLGVYAGFCALQAVFISLMCMSVMFGTVMASRNMHHDLLSNVLKLPMMFFDTTPLGRILNRFSKDVDTLDDQLRLQFQIWLTQCTTAVATVVIITYNTPVFLAAAVPLIIVFAVLQRIYVKAARQLKRIDSIKRSPVYANFTETLNGVTSIRAYLDQERFIQNADDLLDNHNKVWFAVFTSNRWIGVVSQSIANLVVLFTAIFCVTSRDTLGPGAVGVSLTYALQLSFTVAMVMRTTCDLESYIVAVERLAEYTEEPTEAPWNLSGTALPPNWPTKGLIEFEDFSMRYRPGLDLVLNGVTCSITPGEKVGVVGRTGAGKSSLTMALFRMVERAGGRIRVDSRDISKLGLHDIRENITIIPQDAVVFSGSLRFNLDPEGHRSDVAIWNALEHAHLKPYIQSTGQGLDFECGEDGQNISAGQRQLLCLARALLRRTTILVLDEATASVDLETDELIQLAIRQEFTHCTILTVAHRLNTIMDYDKVMVMSQGHVVEFAPPAQLLDDEDSIFHSMAEDAGLL